MLWAHLYEVISEYFELICELIVSISIVRKLLQALIFYA